MKITKKEAHRALTNAPMGRSPFLAGYTVDRSTTRHRFGVSRYFVLRDASGVVRFTNTDAQTLADVFVRMYAQWEA